MEVIINGVRYIPVKEVRPSNSRAIKLALLEGFWGDCSSSTEEELDKKWDGVYIYVTDCCDPYDSNVLSIDNLIDRIGELS